MIKKISLFAFLLLAVLLLSNSVSAQDRTSYVIEKTVEGIESFFGPIFGGLFGVDAYDEFLFAKILLFFIVLFFVKLGVASIPRLKDQKGIVWVIAVIISVLAIRFLSDSQIVLAVLIPYSTLGILIATIVPFLVFFFFVHGNITSGVGRRLAWMFYLIVLFGIWVNVASDLNALGNYIYVAVFLIALILLIFDRKVREYFALAKVKEARKNIDADNIAEAYKKYISHMNMYRETGDEMFKRRADRYWKYLREAGVKNI